MVSARTRCRYLRWPRERAGRRALAMGECGSTGGWCDRCGCRDAGADRGRPPVLCAVRSGLDPAQSPRRVGESRRGAGGCPAGQWHGCPASASGAAASSTATRPCLRGGRFVRRRRRHSPRASGGQGVSGSSSGVVVGSGLDWGAESHRRGRRITGCCWVGLERAGRSSHRCWGHGRDGESRQPVGPSSGAGRKGERLGVSDSARRCHRWSRCCSAGDIAWGSTSRSERKGDAR